MTTYPPAPPALTGDVLTVNRFLANPALVQRRLRELTLNRFIADVLLVGRYQAAGGAILYEIAGESQYTDRDVEAVNPGAEYPRSTAARGAAALAGITKWGQDVPLTDESIGRRGASEVDRVLRKVGNQIVKKVDTVAMAAIGAAITQTQAAVTAWDLAAADPFLDVMLADAQVTALDEGYDPRTLVMTDVLYARMVSNQKVIAGLAREPSNNVTATGDVVSIAGKRLLRTNRLPAGTSVLLVDDEQLGGLGYENIPSPEYTGDPANGVQSFARRDPAANDQWLLRGRRPVVPIVQEPQAGIKITGAAA